MNEKETTLLIAFISSFIAPFMISAVNIAVPSINSEFHADALMLSWMSTAYLLAAVMFLLPVGRIADIYGRKKIFGLGITIYTASAFLLSLTNNAAEFVLIRFIEGVGAAMIFSTGVAILTEVFPANERGKALGVNVAAVYLGLSLGPSIGGYLTQEFGWRSIFYVNIPVGLLAVALIKYRLKGEWAEARGEKLDYLGSVLYMLALAALIHALETPNMEGILFLLISAVFLFLFLRHEVKAESPILDTTLLRNRMFFTSSMAALINYSATYIVAFLLSLYLQYIKMITPQQAGMILITQPAIQAIGSPIAGKMSDKISPSKVASAGMAVTVVGLCMLSAINSATEMNYIIASLVVLGVGFSLFSSPNTNAVMSSVEKRQYGVASAFLATMRMTGQMFSTGITMTLFAIYLPHTEITPDKYPVFLQTIDTAFKISALLCLFGVFLSLTRVKKKYCSA